MIITEKLMAQKCQARQRFTGNAVYYDGADREVDLRRAVSLAGVRQREKCCEVSARTRGDFFVSSGGLRQ